MINRLLNDLRMSVGDGMFVAICLSTGILFGFVLLWLMRFL